MGDLISKNKKVYIIQLLPIVSLDMTCYPPEIQILTDAAAEVNIGTMW